MKETLNFLTKEECDYFIEMIDKNHSPSSVVEGGEQLSTISDTRTSSTCNLNHRDEKVQQLQKNKEDGMIFGVCSGLSDSTGLDVTLIRFATIAGAILTGSLIFWVYLALAILLPKKSKD